jgi:hypothetical protein
MNIPSIQKEQADKNDSNENPKEKLEEAKKSNERELKRLNQKAQEIFRNGKNLLDQDSQNDTNTLIQSFDQAIMDGDIETAIMSMETISSIIDLAPENVESHGRALQKLDFAKKAGIFAESQIAILSSEEDKSLPERQFKIISPTSGMFQGGIIMKMDELNSLFFSKGMTKENLEKTYLEMASREINKLFERSENNLDSDLKTTLSAAIESLEDEKNEAIKKAELNKEKYKAIDTATLLDQQIDEKAEKELWEAYQKENQIDIESGKDRLGKPLIFTEEPVNYTYPYEKNEVTSQEQSPEQQTSPKQNPKTLTEEKPDTSLLLKLAENKKEIPPKLESKLKELLTEKYKDLPLEIRSETINLAMRQTLLYYSRKLTQAQINATKRLLENKKVPKLEIYDKFAVLK